MELYQIRYFLAVSRTLNFTQAAEDCNVTQPALTRAIKKLEEELGGELFRRERARSHLTDLGKAMVPFLQQSYDAAHAAKAEAENFGRGTTAPLTIGLSASVSSSLLRGILRELARAVPGLDLALERAPAVDIGARLEAGDIDFGVIAENDRIWDRAQVWPLFDEDFVACHSETDTHELSPQALDGRVLLQRPHCESAETVRTYFEAEGIVPERKHALSSDADAAALIGIDECMVLLPRSTVGDGGFGWSALIGMPLRRTVVLMSAAGRRHSIAGSTFLRLMRAADWPQA